ncbi:hypothetical protein NGM67_15765 [Photobacterium damselae]|uniref:hypothetical protein n=1 Tax=Photobacterium damselae TaxID=38293 RepID=UPI002091DFED|nr:hypothetical protein [Photobacterium damselae]USR76604.1 hypothetical protein NGM67_15765 [Photobacterium damselae]
MVIIDKNPVVNFSSMKAENRKDGLSGFIRAKNEGDYIYQVIESWIELVDELVIVFNDCTDNTESEICRAIKDFGCNKIKAYKYIPKVYPQGSDEHINLPCDDIHSLVNYYNYSLSKTTRKFVVKIDGDIIFDPCCKHKIKSFMESQKINGFYKLHGVNLIDNDGMLFVPSNSMFCGMNGDLCIFPVSEKNVFKHRPEFEYLDLSDLKDCGGSFAYYHMKFVKRDMGFSNYLLNENPNSRYVEITKKFIVGLSFIPIDIILNKYNIKLSSPETLGINSILSRDFKKSYINNLNATNVKINLTEYLLYYFSNIKYRLKQNIKFVVKKYAR